MKLFYDRMAQMFTLETEEEAKFLGPITQTMLTLQKEFELTESQARDAVVRAVMNDGFGIDIANVKATS